MRKIIAIGLIVAAALTGCGGAAPPPEATPKAVPKAAPVEKTPEMIAAELRNTFAPLKASLGSKQDVEDPVKAKVIADLRAAMTANAISENGKRAISQVSHDMEEIVRQARDLKLWSSLMCGIEAYETLVPGDAKFSRLKEQGALRMKRPKVKIRGFFNVDTTKDEIYAFLEITDSNGETHNVKVRPGEEFDNLRFVRIIGDQKGVELEYLPIAGELFEVMK